MKRKITLLSFGGGQDSTAILLKMITDRKIMQKYAPDHLVVIMSDTGNEHKYTYDHVANIQKICMQERIPFFFIKKEMGFHTNSWPDLLTPQLRSDNEELKPAMVQMNTASCTINLKITPIYKFLDEYVNDFMGYGFKVYEDSRGCKKKAIKQFHKDGHEIDVLIGYAVDEEKRYKKASRIELREKEKAQEKRDKKEAQLREKGLSEDKISERISNMIDWKEALNRKYPLVDLEMDREKCQSFIESCLGYCPPPSNCMLCPYQSEEEIAWLLRHDKKMTDLWVKIEESKIKRFEGTEKNYGVFLTKEPMRTKLFRIENKYREWSDERLLEYKMSHGCQTNAM